MIQPIRVLLLLFLVTVITGAEARSVQKKGLTLNPVNLRCDYAVNPIGIDNPSPQFDWNFEATYDRGQMQTAYQILVASSETKLKNNTGDVWDSGKVTSDQNIHVSYAGQSLKSGMRYYWKVRVWDRAGKGSEYSQPSFFEMGLLQPAEWKAKWITITPKSDEDRSPLARAKWIYVQNETPAAPNQKLQLWRSFTVQQAGLRRAEMYYAADVRDRERGTLLFVNGKLNPSLWRSQRQLKSPSVFDLRSALKAGTNTIAVETAYAPSRGFIALIHLEYDDGQIMEIGTDAEWKARVSESRESWKDSDLETPGWNQARVVGKFGDILDNNETYRRIDKFIPPPYLRKSVAVTKPVRSARVYASATGVYELWLNGQRVGHDVFSPGWTDYSKRIQFQTYDVTPLLRDGPNVIGGIVGDGWYSGHNGLFNANPNHYGYEKALLCQLNITYADGTSEVFASDDTWRGRTGAIRYSDMFMGETYDARKETTGWDRNGYDDSSWQPAVIVTPSVGPLTAQADPPVRPTMELPAKSLLQPQTGVYIFDLGQNMVGHVRLKMRGKTGDRVRIRYGEVLNTDGTLFTENLRTALSTDYYYIKGGGQEVYEPHFTFHGFRYVELTGYPGQPAPTDVTGIVLRSDLGDSGYFEASNPMLNQLQSNIIWGQRGNFLSVPTDCPQRDERDGWTGDIQAFSRTATFNMDSAAFLNKWLIDLEHGQGADGSLPDIAPTTATFGRGKFGWGDAGVMVPWTLYQVYDDRRMIKERYAMMAGWVEYLRTKAKGYLAPTDSYGDWVSPKPEAPKDVLSTAYFARVTWQLSKMALAIGKEEDARRYEKLFQQIKAAFNQAYVSPDGTIKSDTQTVYVVALRFNLLPEAHRPAAAKHLVSAIERADWHIGTGFLGAVNLLPVLTEAGYTDVAYRLLNNNTFPSWGYSIKNGATTVWERWDGYDPAKGPSNMGNMNSYNHYAFGSVGEWMYANIAGIDTDSDKPGFKHIIVHPRPDASLSWAKGEYNSIRGKIKSSWSNTNNQFRLQVSIPINTTATVYVPAPADGKITEGGKPAQSAEGVKFVGVKNGTAMYEVGSGDYDFRCASVINSK